MSFEAVSILQRLRQRPARSLGQQQRARSADEAQAAEDQQGQLGLSVALEKIHLIRMGLYLHSIDKKIYLAT